MGMVEKIHQIVVGYKTKEAKGFEVWMVYWEATNHCYWRDKVVKAKSFVNKEDADAFVTSLKDAHKLLQNEDSLQVWIKRQK